MLLVAHRLLQLTLGKQASGNLGPAILTPLRESKLFDVTVLTRQESNHKFRQDVKVKPVDYASKQSLATALQGQDGLVSTLSIFGIESQKTLIDAAIEAGVQRFIPSEFGSGTLNPKAAGIPIFGPKLQVQKYLKAKAAEKPSFSYTSVFPGTFLDWGFAADLLADLKGKSATIKDSGDVPFSASRL